MQLICTTDAEDIIEPVIVDDIKAFMGYPATETTQDLLIESMIISAREWLEQRTALSIVSKNYKVYFEIDEAEDGWYELPVSPVTGTPVVKMTGVTITFQQKGLKRVSILPASAYSSILVGTTSDVSYLEVTFTGGESNNSANSVLMELVSFMFNNREGSTTLNLASLPYDLRSRINALSVNF